MFETNFSGHNKTLGGTAPEFLPVATYGYAPWGGVPSG